MSRVPLLTAVCTALVVGALGVKVALAVFTDAPSVPANTVTTDTLNAPTNLTATGGGAITLNWMATVDTYASGYRVLRSATSGGPYAQIAQLTPRTLTTYTDTPAAGTYYYVVRAYYQSWESADSSQVNATTTASLMRMVSGSFTGNGADNRSITGVGFQPDVVFVKCACGQRSVVRTSTMPGDASKAIGLTGTLLANLVQSLDADGFTVGTDARVNSSGQTIYWTAMKAGTALNVGSYVGSGVDNRSITGVGFQPVWVMTMGNGEDSWFRPSTIAGDASFAVDGNNTFTNRIQSLEADGFQLGSNVNVNLSGTTFHYVAWKASGAVVQTTYAGNGLDNRSITGVGFQPQFLWVHRESTNPGVWRPSSVTGDSTLYFTATAATADRLQALEADGFQVGTADQVNNAAGTYHYLALRDSP